MDYKKLYKNLEESIKRDYSTTIHLKYDHQDKVFIHLNVIFINKSNPWKHRFYALMHEVGHIIINSRSDKDLMYVNDYENNKNTKKTAIKVLNEEIDAWNEGRRYADKRINYKIDKMYYEKIKTESVFSYIKTSIRNIYGSKVNI